MRTMTLSLLLALAAFQALAADVHTSKNSLDWAGVYRGILPCADCEGIETTLKLTTDLEYELSMKYLGKSTVPFSSTGSFQWRPDGRTIMLKTSAGTPKFYRVEENRLRQLDTRGKPITGALADKYVLQKIAADTAATQAQPTLENTYWKLIRLGKTTVTAADNQREPYLILHPADQRVSGSGGCNQLTGTYELEGNRLTFSQMAGTRMACPSGMEHEQAFHDALGRAATWRIEEEKLELSDASGNVIARFESRYTG
jgi:copper homeostasis protein (lipoprotein)